MTRLLFVIGLILRLILIAAPSVEDITHFSETASIIQNGGNLYVEQFYYNYSPVLAHVVSAIDVLRSNLDYGIAHRLLLTVVDLGVAFTVYKVTRKRLIASIWFMASGVFIYNGQFDTLALLPVIASVIHPAFSVLFAGSGILIKQSVFPLAWCVLVSVYGVQRALLFVVGIGAVFLLTMTPYIPDGLDAIIRNVLLYSTAARDSGVTWLTYPSSLLFPVGMTTIIMYAGILLLPVILKQQSLTERLFIVSLWIMVFIPFASQQYMVIPLLCVALTGRLRILLALATVLVLTNGVYGILGAAWGVCALTLLYEVWNSHLNRRKYTVYDRQVVNLANWIP